MLTLHQKCIKFRSMQIQVHTLRTFIDSFLLLIINYLCESRPVCVIKKLNKSKIPFHFLTNSRFPEINPLCERAYFLRNIQYLICITDAGRLELR
jgi:hypothetical protein